MLPIPSFSKRTKTFLREYFPEAQKSDYKIVPVPKIGQSGRGDLQSVFICKSKGSRPKNLGVGFVLDEKAYLILDFERKEETVSIEVITRARPEQLYLQFPEAMIRQKLSCQNLLTLNPGVATFICQVGACLYFYPESGVRKLGDGVILFAVSYHPRIIPGHGWGLQAKMEMNQKSKDLLQQEQGLAQQATLLDKAKTSRPGTGLKL